MVREISNRMMDVLFKAARERSIPLERLAEGTEYSVAYLENKKERIEWPAFVRICANAGKLWSDEELEALGGAFFRTPLVRSILTPARLLFTPRGLYQWILGDPKGLGQQMVPCATNAYKELGPDRAQLVLTFPPDYERCPQFFTITKGSISGMPCALGLDPAKVNVTNLPNGASFEIVYPAQRGFVYDIRRAITWPFTVRAAAAELKSAHEELTSRYTQLEDYRLNLEKKVEERTNELARTVTELREAQESRDKLFANINHEIRTPLSLISLAGADIRGRRSDLDARSLLQLEGMDAASRQLLRLVDGLLLLAAGQEDRLRLRLTNIDLAATARATVTLWTTAAESRGLSIGYDGPSELVAPLDEAAVDRILSNLVSNAMKFTPSGGTVGVEIREGNGQIEIAVRDTGVGIDEEFKERIFGRFEQGRAAVHAGTHGSGVGLSLVRELARAHGGDVALETPASGGSRFVVTLPSRPAPAMLASFSARSGEATSGPQAPADFGIAEVAETKVEVLEPTHVYKGTILIAEDDPALRGQIADLLRADHRVVVASDGISALSLARKHLPDMLVSDIGMPGMDGIELTRRFREMNENRLAPVLLLTAFGEVRKRLQGFDAGAVDYILKPFDPEELRARVRAQLLLRSLALRLQESEKSVALGVVSTGLAHELRNPANGIVNAIGPLRKLLPPDALREDSPSGKLLKVIEQCTEQLSLLSRQLLGLRSGAELERVDARVPDLVERAQSVASASLAGRTVEVQLGYSGTIACAPSTILQALANLLENAAHAAGPGGWVRISTALDGPRVVFEIADSGPGVPNELRQKIFEPFFTTKPPGVGTGLGLASAREIVVRHSGAIDVRSGSPGAVFRIELPVRPADSRPERKSATS